MAPPEWVHRNRPGLSGSIQGGRDQDERTSTHRMQICRAKPSKSGSRGTGGNLDGAASGVAATIVMTACCLVGQYLFPL